MIIVASTTFNIDTIINNYPVQGIERQLLNKMSTSNGTYEYNNINQLKFELDYRREIVNSAFSLNDSGLNFATFKNSKCNPKYWIRTENGGFLKKESAKSNEAINDIFVNGEMYATECATAMMIVYYKGLLNVYGNDLFNKIFANIYLLGWVVAEPLLKNVVVPQITSDILLGDRGYFSNPDFDPSTPEWEGENVIVLPNSMYYGHGIGIATSDTIIQDLNSRRKEGATQSAFFDDSVGRPNFKELADVYYHNTQNTPLVWRAFPAPFST